MWNISNFDLFIIFLTFDAVLSFAPSDEDALRCKVVALIKNDKIDQALTTIQESAKKFPVDFSFLKVIYLHYPVCLNFPVTSASFSGWS